MATLSSVDVPPAGRTETSPGRRDGLQAPLPEYVPIPREGQVEFYSGLRKGFLNNLILPCEVNGFKPPVRSVSLKKPGLTKGKRLIVLRGKFSGGQLGLLDYLDAIRDAQEYNPAPGK